MEERSIKQKIFISGSCLTLALSLVSCGGQQTEQEPPQVEDVQQSESVTEKQPAELTAEPAGVKPEDMSAPTTGAEEDEGQSTEDIAGSDVTDGEDDPEVQLFTDCNEAVWATGTVNLRSGPSTEDNKVGSLDKGNSVTRTGIGTGDYSSWSRVKLADGSEVYVASSYLTTTKSSTGGSNSKPSGNTSTQTQQPTQQDPSSGDRGSTSGWDSFGEVITDPIEISTGTDNPYAGYGEVNIGYGG